MNVLIETRFVRALLQFNKKPVVPSSSESSQLARKVVFIEQAGDKIRAYATNGHIAAIYTQNGFDMQAERESMVIDRQSLKNALSMLDGVEAIWLQNFSSSSLIKISSDDGIFNCSALSFEDYPDCPIDKVFDQLKEKVSLESLNWVNPDYLIPMSRVGQILSDGYSEAAPYLETLGQRVGLLVKYIGVPEFKAIISPMRATVHRGLHPDLRNALDAMNKFIAEGMDYADAQYRASSAYDVSAENLQKAYDAESADAV